MLEGSTEILALADALRTPLVRLLASSESVHDSQNAKVIIEHALRDIDAFITTYTLHMDAQVRLEPIALGSLLKDTSEKLKPYAKIARINLSIDDRASHRLVVGDHRLLSLGLEMITKTVCDLVSDVPNPVVTMRADTRHGYPRLGVYRDDVELTAYDMKLARKLIGGAQVNAGLLPQLGALRVLLAERLLEPIGLTLRSAKAKGGYGMALRLKPSMQASLFGE